MLRIRQYEHTPAGRRVLREVQKILGQRLAGLPRREIDALPDKLFDPITHGFRALLFVAEEVHGRLLGFALVSHDPELRFCFLDYLVSSGEVARGGVGGALYERVRDAARLLDCEALLFECSPDDPTAVRRPQDAVVNAARLRFYARHGAYPILGTGYEAPIRPGDLDLPHLLYDDLGRRRPLRRSFAQRAVRAILERKYAHLCPPAYVDQVVDSFRDDPVKLRTGDLKPRAKGAASKPIVASPERDPRRALASRGEIALVVSDRHQIHHVRERGYFEAPVRIKAILDGILPTRMFERLAPQAQPEKVLRAIHDADLIAYLEKACASVQRRESIYPYVFPIRNAARPPRDLAYCAGYYCIDTFTPIHRNAFKAAKRGVDCAITAADSLLAGRTLAYALVRPPGHHAERRVFGGFCYFNNAAAAAEHLSAHGKVAILDIDYHHGNGQQDIFYARSDVLTVSLHGHPRFAYPFFSGFEDERGVGAGEGFNLNLALPEKLDGKKYLRALRTALAAIEAFGARFLVVCLGLDTAKRDPTGSWLLEAADFHENGREIGALGLETVVVQEGGYRSASLGLNARRFFEGLAETALDAPST